MCNLCDGSGWMAYPHPDNEGGLAATAYGKCPGCVGEGVCPACGQVMMDWGGGALLICVYCGFSFDEANEPRGERPAARQAGGREDD